mmetsp:Transcript_28105/g.71232  ORF Transcript_28105/g.71232 Transcript_28105/m.71232 type:complete len:265 (+) Transcript_28105:1940-2734(+)
MAAAPHKRHASAAQRRVSVLERVGGAELQVQAEVALRAPAPHRRVPTDGSASARRSAVRPRGQPALLPAREPLRGGAAGNTNEVSAGVGGGRRRGVPHFGRGGREQKCARLGRVPTVEAASDSQCQQRSGPVRSDGVQRARDSGLRAFPVPSFRGAACGMSVLHSLPSRVDHTDEQNPAQVRVSVFCGLGAAVPWGDFVEPRGDAGAEPLPAEQDGGRGAATLSGTLRRTGGSAGLRHSRRRNRGSPGTFLGPRLDQRGGPAAR